MPGGKPQTTAPWWQYLEDAGYAAGLTGKDIDQSKGWDTAWGCHGENYLMFIMAGWVAGRAVRRVRAETEKTGDNPMPNETTDGEPKAEYWHRRTMDVSWTDSGKMIIRHDLKDGGRISHAFDIEPEKAKAMRDWMDV